MAEKAAAAFEAHRVIDLERELDVGAPVIRWDPVRVPSVAVEGRDVGAPWHCS